MASSSSTSRDNEPGKTSATAHHKYSSRIKTCNEKINYSEDWAFGDDEEIEGVRSFSIQDKLDSDRFNESFVKQMDGKDFTVSYLQKYGFSEPLLFKDKTGLGLHVPSQNFSVKDVCKCVGSKRMLDVMDVNTQKNVEMTMKEWTKYYEDPKKENILNVISLEFSHTKLENYIKRPNIVRELDWVDCVWPKHLKESQIESTNAIDEMMYPKVQKYCLMSVKGCYTDFHVDFGGTSVWYHILRGSKVFWLIPPTEESFKLYELWILSGKQGDIFFGDTVKSCGRVSLNAGDTFFIPTGWIHAVYTPEDSLVFGGNFLHSFGIDFQLRVAEVEESTKVPQKFRYPFFTEMLWYVLERYVFFGLGKSHLKENADNSPAPTEHIHFTKQELLGILAIVRYLHQLPPNKKNVPPLIQNAIELIKNVSVLINKHQHDKVEDAITGKPILKIQGDNEKERKFNKSAGDTNSKVKTSRKSGNSNSTATRHKRRRTRCKECEACKQSDCGECTFCIDMVKFGGPGRAKQTCVMRQCLQPMLPITAACGICSLDGWGQQVNLPIQKASKDTPSNLMECRVCFEIVHPDCMLKQLHADDLSNGTYNEDIPNSWECPKCCKKEKNLESKTRQLLARQNSSNICRTSVSSSDANPQKLSKENGESTDSNTESDVDNFPSKRLNYEKNEGPYTPSRVCKEKINYSEDWAFGDEEEIEGVRTFSIQDKLDSDRFNESFVKQMDGKDFTVSYLQKYGFSEPLLFKDKTGLGLNVPSQNFSVNDVCKCVGSKRMLDVMDVNTQKNVEMTMKEWTKYYEDPKKENILNVISLEFSHTKLENYIKRPNIVRELDWVDCVWPKHLKESQIESTNAIDEMMYPKVQKYCLMSVKGCYTDFHVDFGGTSVWYHILRGSKVFWLIPPTEESFKLYELWILSGKQGDIFFGDTVKSCGRVSLNAGDTFFIPTGWIHAVYTPEDSLVFGGNFLHSFGIDFQLRVAEVEESTKVPQKFRYPFFTEMLWYVLERYVFFGLGKSHLKENADNSPAPTEHIHFTKQELLGILAIVRYLHQLPPNKKNVPPLIQNAIELIKNVSVLINKHQHDKVEDAITGKPILKIQGDNEKERKFNKSAGDTNSKVKTSRKSGNSNSTATRHKRRRTRCKECEACKQSDCGECTFCIDMVKFGGPGRAKQTCVMRQCLQPMLPITAACGICSLDGWGHQVNLPIQKASKDTPSNLMECRVCFEIVHPDCMLKQLHADDLSNGTYNEDIPNSWECPKCCKKEKNLESKTRQLLARQNSSNICRTSVSSSDANPQKLSKENGESTDSNTESDVDNFPSKRLNYEKNEGPYTPSRVCKEKINYSEDWAFGDEEEIEGVRTFSIQDKLDSDRFNESFVKQMDGKDFTVSYLQKYGFSEPLLFKDKTGLGLNVPSQNFSVNDVCKCVGSKRMLDVMDVNTQKNVEMTMKEWTKYYEDPKKENILNVISLEFSHTKLENYIKRPNIVRELDWVDCVWPKHLKESQIESTNAIDEMMYPKVQKYCLMSVKGCYTDFHVDFGGTSVWYHILRGSKVFWLIPPTEESFKLYELWILSGKQGDIFFGDTVKSCGRVSLNAGDTFFIPTGWIHAVYTPEDSLVFGGNFLHSFGIDFQLRVAEVEESTKVPQKFRYPFFTEMLWYVLERYVFFGLGKSHLKENADNSPAPTEHIHFTKQEFLGIKAIVRYLHKLPPIKKNVPPLIQNAIELIKNVLVMMHKHKQDNVEYAITGKPILKIQEDKTRQLLARQNSSNIRRTSVSSSDANPQKLSKEHGESTDSNSESDVDNFPSKRLKYEKNEGPYTPSNLS